MSAAGEAGRGQWAPRGPRHVSDGLNRLLRGLGAPPTDVVAALFELWPALAGAEMAEHSRPVRVVNRRLVVEVEDSAWAARLRLEEASLLARLAAHFGSGAVRSIRPRVVAKSHRDDPRRR